MKKILIPSIAALVTLVACQAQPIQVVQTPPASIEPQPRETQESRAIEPTPTQAPSTERVMKPTGNFHFDEKISDYVGTLYLQGTVNVVEMSEGFCEENCKKFKYAYLNYDSEFDAGNEALKKFMGMNDGNSFAGGNSIGLGCVEDGGIRRKAFENGEMKEFTIGQPDATTMLNASQSKPVVVKFNRPDAVPGMGAPDCYTHFTGIELIQFADNA